jgi:large subunit ribosomal protein L4
MGTNRSPIRRGGGVAFGPSQRSYVKKLPKRMRRLAIRSVLASRVAEERLTVVDSLGLEQPSTKVARALLGALGVERSALIVTGEADRVALLSVRNVPGVSLTPADTLSVAEMLGHQNLILTIDAVRRIEALWGGERASGRGGPLPVAVGG